MLICSRGGAERDNSKAEPESELGVRIRESKRSQSESLVSQRGNRYRMITLVKKIGREGGNDIVREKYVPRVLSTICLCTIII